MDLSVERKIQLDKGKTKIRIDKTNTNKSFIIELIGQFDQKAQDNFFIDYKNKIKEISVNEYDLIVDCHLLGVIQSNLIDGVKVAFKEYYSKFKSVKIITPGNIVGKIQLKRIAKECKDFVHIDFAEK